MPQRAKRPCRQCQQIDCSCRKAREIRGTAHQRGYDAQHRADRLRHLAQHPCCAACLLRGMVTPATVLDHIDPIRMGTAGWQHRLRDTNNFASMCATCHNIKTAKGL